VAGLSSLVDVLHGVVPKRDLLGATAMPAVGLTSPEHRWRCPAGLPAFASPIVVLYQ
jgi:hypothetical protein